MFGIMTRFTLLNFGFVAMVGDTGEEAEKSCK
jgi:hypothetical protein